MTYLPVQMWTAQCDGDGCDETWPHADSEYAGWSDRSTVDELIGRHSYYSDVWCCDWKGGHWCEAHCPHCVECERPGGPYGPESDGMCDDCHRAAA